MSQDKNLSEIKFEPAQPIKVAGLVDYQQGSIVSREILKGGTAKVMLFAFDEGEALSEHTSPFHALVQIVEGEAEITVASQQQRVTAGEFILMPAQQPHALAAVKRFKMILTMIRS
jgi:quercetin dioxygenase-like cupin family protein